MKTLKMMTAFAALAMLASGANAYSVTTQVSPNDKAPVEHACFPSTGNWVNAATQSCPDRGSGGVGLHKTVEVKEETQTAR